MRTLPIAVFFIVDCCFVGAGGVPYFVEGCELTHSFTHSLTHSLTILLYTL
jgi:hypothetical protein